MYEYLLLIVVIVSIGWGIVSVVRNATENPIDDGAKEIMRFSGSKLLGASMVEELILTDQYIMSRRFEPSGYIKRKIYYSDIAQINIKKGLVACKLEIVNRGEGTNVGIKGLRHKDAIRVQQMLFARKSQVCRDFSVLTERMDQLERLSALVEQGVLSHEEFEKEKSRILAG